MPTASKLLIALACLATIGTQAARAAEFARRDPLFPERDYTCRLDGEDVRLGESRCLRTTQGRHMAVCAIALNMSTWAANETACP